MGLAVVLRDITLLKNLERMKNEFVNTVSHDLKSPITVIAGLADLMRMAGPSDPNFEKHCRDIRDTAQHMADLVTDLLDIGKIEAGLDVAREPMDLVPVAEEALHLVGPNAERKRRLICARSFRRKRSSSQRRSESGRPWSTSSTTASSTRPPAGG